MKYLVILISALALQSINAQDHNNDWAQLKKYANDNMEVNKMNDLQVVFLGNSITEGWVNAMPDFFIDNNYIGRGISGQTTPQVLLRMRQDVIDLHPRAVVINIGINDIAENTGPYDIDFTVDNIRSMIEIAQANDIIVIIASVLPADRFVWRPSINDVANKVIQLNDELKKLTEKYGIHYLDYHTTLKNENNGLSHELAEDGVHPTIVCYKIMANLAEQAIRSALD